MSNTDCNKRGGVCSIRLYEGSALEFKAIGLLCTTCPNRFLEGGTIFRWIGETILNEPAPRVLKQIEFLQGVGSGREEDDVKDEKEVGRIDHVLVAPKRKPLEWCAVEMQSVYFSGNKMTKEFTNIEQSPDLPLMPIGRRHPDYRSSGPKRLMPQLQVKVPTLRRWGRKMAVVVDEPFFHSLGPMDEVKDLSNCDIVWFIVGYEEDGVCAHLVPRFLRMTTLERAVEGLTGGRPVSRTRFEETLVRRLERLDAGATKTHAK